MELHEWEPIATALFSAFPQANVTAETALIYFADLREFDTRDVDNACTYLRQNTGPFAPSIAVIREQVRTESQVRMEWESVPNWTGSHLLQEAEQRELDERSMHASLEQRDRSASTRDLERIRPQLPEKS